MMRTAVITIAHGRHAHLRAQQEGLALSAQAPDDYIIVAMDDPEIRAMAPPFATVVDVPSTPLGLPLSRARNLGAAAAIAAGAELLIFLDVDCIPGQSLVGGYADAAGRPALQRSLLSGPVTYLDPHGVDGYPIGTIGELDAPHPARPAPAPGEVARAESPDLFWSLSFALSVETWGTIGGFCEEYSGYGGEDTDFGYMAASCGIDLVWVGAARAYHQWHETSTPPTQHLDDIVRNANVFFTRWQTWPMRGWLDEFRARGLITGGVGTASARRRWPRE